MHRRSTHQPRTSLHRLQQPPLASPAAASTALDSFVFPSTSRSSPLLLSVTATHACAGHHRPSAGKDGMEVTVRL